MISRKLTKEDLALLAFIRKAQACNPNIKKFGVTTKQFESLCSSFYDEIPVSGHAVIQGIEVYRLSKSDTIN